MKRFLLWSVLILTIGCGKKDTPLIELTSQPVQEESPIGVENEVLTPKETFIRKIFNASLKGETKVEVGEFNISEVKRVQGQDYLYAEDLEYKNWYDVFKIQNPYLFHLDYIGEYVRQYKQENPDEVQSYTIGYAFQPHKMQFYYTEIEKSLENYYSELREGMSEADIAYTLYNHLIKQVEYKEDGLPFHAVGALVHQKAVCEGYSLAYRLMMNLLGIETQMVISGILPNSSIAHAWNRVKIGGEWYNADATWDDNPKKLPFTYGKYFLTSDERFHNKEKHPRALDRYQIPPANSTLFDMSNVAFFRYNPWQTESIFKQGYWYYINSETDAIFKAKIGEMPLEVVRISPKLPTKEMRMAFGKEKIYYIDLEDHNTEQYAIFSVDFQGKNKRKERNINKEEVFSADLNGTDEPQMKNDGSVLLRTEMALSRLKELYHHGDEDYFAPKNAQRIALKKTLKQAEDFFQRKSANEAEAQALAKQLQTQRKAYAMPFSGGRG